MTIGELKLILDPLRDNLLVVVPGHSDSSGLGYSTISAVRFTKVLENDTWEGDFYEDDAGDLDAVVIDKLLE